MQLQHKKQLRDHRNKEKKDSLKTVLRMPSLSKNTERKAKLIKNKKEKLLRKTRSKGRDNQSKIKTSHKKM